MTVDHAELARDIESFRRELVAHCYRMSGSYEEAQDLVQETFLRAWRAADTFEGRASTRTWLYRIATNVCLTALQHRGRRVLPSGLAGDDDGWLQPFPTGDTPDPAEVVTARSHLRLARATLQAQPMSAEDVSEPDGPAARALLDGYMKAFETADVAVIADLLHSDATIEVAPTGATVSGKASCVPYLADEVLRAPGEYRMLATSANGQPAAIAYRATETGWHRAFGIAVLTINDSEIRTISVFAEPRLVEVFGYPPAIEDDSRRSGG